MKIMNLKKLNKSILFAISLFIFTATAFATQSISLYVQEHQTVVCPSLPSGYSVYACTFASPSTAITTYSVGYYGGYIKVDSYFTGSVSVQCNQYYYYYVGNYRYAGHRTTYYTITCKPINIILSDTYKEMTPGSYHNITYTSNPSNSGYNPVVTWESNNLSVAQVSSTGRVHAIAPGTATITAHNGSGPDKTCTVIVQAPSPTAITVTPETLSFPRSQSRTLSHSVSPSNANYSLIWTSSNTSVATVSNGTVYGVAPGNATITARISGTSISDYCYVTVQPIVPTSIDIPALKTVNVGQNVTITPTVTPSNADYSVTWTSSNTSVATVNNGVVHGVNDGSARILARITGTTLYDTCWVNVYKPTLTLHASASDGWVTPGTTITLTASDNTASVHYTTDGSIPTQNSTLYTGPISVYDSLTLKAITYHENYNPSTVLSHNYKVNNFQVCSNTPTNYTTASLPTIPSVTFNKSFTEGEDYSNIKLYVGTSISDVIANGNEVTGEKYIDGNTLYYIPTNSPSGVTESYRLHIPAASLQSEDEEPNWEHSVYYTLGTQSTGQYVQSIGFASTEDSFFLSVGERHILHPSIYPTNGIYDTLYWQVSNPSIVSVSSYGVIDALNVGSATVSLTAVASNNIVYATSYVTVTSEFEVSTAVEGCIGGSVSGDGTFPYLSQATVTAIAAPCYHFVQWNDGVTTNPREFTLTQDTAFTAVFAYNEPTTGYESATTCDSFFWKGNTYLTSGTYFFNMSTVMGCDSTIMLNLTVNHTSSGSEIATACDNYHWNGNTYSASGSYIFQSTNAAGCDSTTTLHLTINHSTSGIETVTACNNYTWHGTTYHTSTTNPTCTINNSVGCDSVVSLYLTINHNTNGVEIINACDNYTWHGTTYYVSTSTPTHTTTNAAGCDSITTLNLTISHGTFGIEDITACNSYEWHGVQYTASTSLPTHSSINTAGCDSITELHLSINHCSTTEVSACGSYSWHGSTYTSSGEYLDGNDTLILTINHASSGTEILTACDSITWHGTTYCVSTISPTYTTTNMFGCDSIITLHLTIRNSSASPYSIMRVCDSTTLWGQLFTDDSVIHHIMPHTNRYGCDSTERVWLYVNHTTHTSSIVEACDSYNWNNHTYTQTPDSLPVYRQTDWNGCVNTDTLYLTIHQGSSSIDVIETCDSLIWHGIKYSYSTTSPTYEVPDGNMYGCDSIVHLNLTINHSNSSQYTTLMVCDSVSLWGCSYVEDAVISHIWPNSNIHGCDSIENIILHVSHTSHTSSTVEACDSYYWNYQIYTQTPDTLPVYRHTDWNGCLNTDTLYLTIHHASSSTDIIETCDSVIWHGTKYTYSATWPTYEVPCGNVYGCDSTVHLNLTIHRSATKNVYVTENSSSYHWNDSVYTQSGTYTWIGSTVYGCDSVVTLHLTLDGVSITDLECITSEINIYPSPTKGVAFIRSPYQIAEVTIYNMNGVAVRQMNNAEQIDLTGVPSGVYLVKVITPTKTSIIKIIKE